MWTPEAHRVIASRRTVTVASSWISRKRRTIIAIIRWETKSLASDSVLYFDAWIAINVGRASRFWDVRFNEWRVQRPFSTIARLVAEWPPWCVDEFFESAEENNGRLSVVTSEMSVSRMIIDRCIIVWCVNRGDFVECVSLSPFRRTSWQQARLRVRYSSNGLNKIIR